MKTNAEKIPNELKEFNQWVGYRPPKKTPVNPNTGRNASITDPETWGSCDEGLKAVESFDLDGVGFVFADTDPFVGIDFDHCRDAETREITPETWEIIKKINSYAEISPGGEGIHIIAKTTEPLARNLSKRKMEGLEIEMYDHARFFTVTGDHVLGTPPTIEDRTAEIQELHTGILNGAVRGNDSQVLSRQSGNPNGSRHNTLMSEIGMLKQLGVSKVGTIESTLQHAEELFDLGERNIKDEVIKMSDWSFNQSDAPKQNTKEEKPKVQISNRELNEIVDQTLEILKQKNDPPVLFVRSGVLVRIIQDENGKHVISDVKEPWFKYYLSKVCKFERMSNNVPVPGDPPRDLISSLMALDAFQWRLPALDAVVETPVLRKDGTILNRLGYDAGTRLFYAPDAGLKIEEIPDNPTADDVKHAVDLLDEVLADFPFENEASRTNMLGLMITPIARPAIKGMIPLALLDAPQPGTGKSLLADVVMMIATGRREKTIVPVKEEEMQKKITSLLSKGSSIIVFDNLDTTLSSSSLAAALTTEQWTDRQLGKNTNHIVLPQKATWIVTGNNIRLGGDMARRAYSIRLNARESRPWMRTGFKHPDLLEWIGASRGKLLYSVLTLARAWYASGKPEGSVSIGSFDAWAKTIGGILQTAGAKEFLGNLKNLYENADEDTAEWEAFVRALKTTFGSKTFSVALIVSKLDEDPDLKSAVPTELATDEHDGTRFRNRLGRALSKKESVRYGDDGVYIDRLGKDSKRGAILYAIKTDKYADLLKDGVLSHVS